MRPWCCQWGTPDPQLSWSVPSRGKATPGWEAPSPSPRREKANFSEPQLDLRLQCRKHSYIKMSYMWACYGPEYYYLKRRNIKFSTPGSHFGICPPKLQRSIFAQLSGMLWGKNVRKRGRGQVRGGQQSQGTGHSHRRAWATFSQK